MDQESSLDSLEPKTCLERMAKHLVPHMLPKVIAGLLSQLRSVDLWWWMVWTPRPQWYGCLTEWGKRGDVTTRRSKSEVLSITVLFGAVSQSGLRSYYASRISNEEFEGCKISQDDRSVKQPCGTPRRTNMTRRLSTASSLGSGQFTADLTTHVLCQPNVDFWNIL